MGVAFAVVGFVVVAAAALYVSYYLKQKRRQELAAAATRLGLTFSREDTVGCLSFPFSLLQRGDGRGAENLMWGSWQGIPVTEFDYWYYEESTDSKGNRTRTYHRFSCGVTEIAAQCAHLVLDREGLFTRIADHIGLHDIEFESEEFNRRFNVKCADRKFANDILDPRMMDWLVAVDGAFRFEVNGNQLMAFSKRRQPTELVPLLGAAKAFVDHVPRVVYELYGAEASR
jgi:Protein of unknown function (DUF3137)